MRRLILLRHGKSEWPTGMDDLERPLAKRGRKASTRMGDYLAQSGLVPDLAIVSPARRAQETWDLARSALACEITQQNEPRIYEASGQAILGVIVGTAPQVRTLLLIGHNPGFHELARALIGSGGNSDLARLRQKYPTAGLVVIDFDIEQWSDASPGTGNLERFETPGSIEGLADDD